MRRFLEFVRRERVYMLLLIFILTVVAASANSERMQRVKAAKSKTEEKVKTPDEKRQEMEASLAANKPLATIFTIASLIILFMLFLGVIIDGMLVSRRLKKGPIDIRTQDPGKAKWGLVDIFRVSVLILFFSYILVILESFLLGVFPILKNDDIRTVINSTFMDLMVIVFVIHFTVQRYREKLASVGVAFKNFFQNIFYGVVGYIGMLPILFVLLLVTTVIIKLAKYAPKEQVVVEIFMRQNDPTFLLYTSIFAAIAGPIVEELFFRGFLYTAVKKYVGVFWAMLITASFFAFLHAHVVGFLPIMALGFLLAYLYEKTGTLISSVTVHIMHNFGMIILVFLAKAMKGA